MLKKVWFFLTPHIFANGPHLAALTWLWTTKTRSKLPHSHFLPKLRLVPYAFTSFDPLWPISLRFRVKGRRVKYFSFWLISLSVRKKRSGLVYAQFWCHRPSTYLVWTIIPQSFQGYRKSWPGVIGLASSTLQSRPFQKVVHDFRCFFVDKISFPSQTVNFGL